ncbi:transposase [Alienimonas sp. DA493]|uniref:transposase n=1 Tax=Alienimonas sp. DA493 TaxID=3373605 RepID=UPI0037541BC1
MPSGSPRPTPTHGPPPTARPPAGDSAEPTGPFGRDDEPGPWGRPWGWWREIARLIPPPQRRGRRADTDLAAVVAAILYKQASGCPWRRLPTRFPPWQTVYSYHRRWLKDGTLRRIREKAREADG